MSIMTTTRTSRNCRLGNIVLVLYPNSDLRTAKARPSLVIQANDLNTGLPQIIVAMITSNLQRAEHPCRITLRIRSSEGKRSGLLTDSVVMTDNLATIVEAAVYRTIGSLKMAKVDRALRHTLGL